MGFKSNFSKRDTRITVRTPVNPNDVQGFYDADGREASGSETTIGLYAEVMDRASVGRIMGGKILDEVEFGLIVDSRSATNVNILSTVTTDIDTDRYQIVDKYDMNYKYATMLICRKSN